MEEFDVSNRYVFPFNSINFFCVTPSITKTLFGGGVFGFDITVTINGFGVYSYFPITLVFG